MILNTKDIFYLDNRHPMLLDSREEAVASIRRDGWRVVGIIALVYITLMLLFILQRNAMPVSTEGFSNFMLLQIIVMLMTLLLFGISYRRQAQLFAEGEILKGTIDTITPYQNQGRSGVVIKYHFQTTLGEALEGSVGVTVNEQELGRFASLMTYHFQIVFSGMSFGGQSCWISNRDGKGLPEVGATVAVLYRTTRHYMVL